MRNLLCFTLITAFAVVFAAEADAQRGRGGIRPTTEDEKKAEDSAEPAGRGRGGRFGETAEEQPAGRGRGRRGQFGGGQSEAGNPATAESRFGDGGSTNKLFAAIDADSDGVITKAEMEDAILAFARLDEDKDGRLTKEEAGATGGGGHGHGHGGGGGMAGGRGRFGGNQSEQAADQPQGRGRGGFGRGRGFGQRPELEPSNDGKQPVGTENNAAENQPAVKPSGISKSPFDDE